MNAVTETEAWSQGKPGQVKLNPVRLVDGARSILRTIQRFAGAVLVLAAFGLWVTPGANWAVDVALFKLTLSLAMGFSGLALWQMGTGSAHFEIEMDTDVGEVRLMRMIHGRMRPVVRCQFNKLGRVDQEGDILRLWDAEGTFIAEVEMCEASARAKLLEAFRCSGNATG
jgi:hypothetical protein